MGDQREQQRTAHDQRRAIDPDRGSAKPGKQTLVASEHDEGATSPAAARAGTPATTTLSGHGRPSVVDLLAGSHNVDPQDQRADVLRRLDAIRQLVVDDVAAIATLAPAYVHARDAVDLAAVAELGPALVATFSHMHGAAAALAELGARTPRASVPGASIEGERAQAVTREAIDGQSADLPRRVRDANVAALLALSPHRFRGKPVAGVAPVLHLDEPAAQMRARLAGDLERTIGMLVLVAKLRTVLAVPKPDPRELERARVDVQWWGSRPIDLAFLRAALGPLWNQLEATAPPDQKPSAALADASKHAVETGWFGDAGWFDIDLAANWIRLGGADQAQNAVRALYSADPDTRGRQLEQLHRRGLLDQLGRQLGWASVKELHDSLPPGFAEVKTVLQRSFLGRKTGFGPSLDREWNHHATSSHHFISKLGVVGSGLNIALDFMTAGFHSYGKILDARATGQIGDAEYHREMCDWAVRTGIMIAVSLATFGVGDKLVRGAAPVVSTSRAMTAGGVAGSTSTVAGMAAGDAYDVLAHDGAMSSPEDYIKAALLGGGLASVLGGATNRWSRRGQAPESPAWDAAHAQGEALDAAHAGSPTRAQRDLLQAELQRQVPDLGLSIAVRETGARTVVSVVTPGGGPTGIKSLNDKLLGHTRADQLLATRNAIVREVFAEHAMQVVEVDYKATTIVSTRPPSELGPGLRSAMAEVRTRMRPQLDKALRAGLVESLAKAKARDPQVRTTASEQVQNLEAALARLDGDPTASFTLHLGAAELHGGTAASYDQVLASKQNASKAAIMARDPKLVGASGSAAGPHGMIYSEQEFRQLARETVALHEQLTHEQFPWNGEVRPVIHGGTLDVDVLRAARKGAIDTNHLSSTQRATLTKVETFMAKVNTLDYMMRFLGENVEAAGAQTRDAMTLVKHLESDLPISRELANEIRAGLAGTVAQAGTASEAQFYGRAAKLTDRVVLNADIKDLGLDVFRGNERAIRAIARGEPIDAVSRGASDEVIKMKRGIVTEFNAFYRDQLLPRARLLLQRQGRTDALKVLEHEGQPLLLLGGDELTVSVPRVFEDLGLIPDLVAHLQKAARARVAVTRTGTKLSGARGHEEAMKKSEDAHSILKRFEQLARDLRDVADRLSPAKKDEAARLRRLFENLHTTTNERGAIEIRSGHTAATGLDQSEARARQLVKEGSGS